MPFQFFLFLVLIPLIALAGWIVFRLRTSISTTAVSLEWLDGFSLQRYSVLDGLLSEADFQFLAKQPGYSRTTGHRLRRQRHEIFAHYLTELSRDFDRLISLAHLMVVHSERDQAEFASSLWRLRLSFETAMLTVRLRLVIAPLGIRTATAERLVRSLRDVQVQLTSLIPAGLFETAAC